MKPSIGRVVHYLSYGTKNGEYESQCRAAVVTDYPGDDLVSLAVLNPDGLFFNKNCQMGEVGGTWHWPERVE